MTYALTAIRYYTQADPYHYSVDNRPLTDLESRDNDLYNRIQLVDVTGSATPTTNQLPVGWTCTSSGTGVYTINHNLATAAFAIGAVIYDATGGVCTVTSTTTTQINIKTTNLSGTATHLRFQLVVVRY